MSYTRGPGGVESHAVSVTQLCNSTIDVGTLVWGTSSTAWPSASMAIYVPIRVKQRVIVVSLAISNGATVTGNLDLGLYSATGVRLVSTGSTAQSGVNTEQVISVTGTSIGPGLYYLAAAMDGTTGTVRAFSPASPVATSAGLLTEASAFSLPDTATFALSQTLIVIPMLHAVTDTMVA
jgi:hypothetical protein